MSSMKIYHSSNRVQFLCQSSCIIYLSNNIVPIHAERSSNGNYNLRQKKKKKSELEIHALISKWRILDEWRSTYVHYACIANMAIVIFQYSIPSILKTIILFWHSMQHPEMDALSDTWWRWRTERKARWQLLVESLECESRNAHSYACASMEVPSASELFHSTVNN